jgi:hypothetical protein
VGRRRVRMIVASAPGVVPVGLTVVALLLGVGTLWTGNATYAVVGVVVGIAAAVLERQRGNELALRVGRLRQQHRRRRTELWTAITDLRRQVAHLQDAQEKRAADARAWAALFATVTGMPDAGPMVARARPYVRHTHMPETEELAAVDVPVTQWENRGSAEGLSVPAGRPARAAQPEPSPAIPSDAGAV